MMKAAVLHTEGIAFAPLGIAIVKAVVLGKFVLLGNAVHDRWAQYLGPADLADPAKGVRLPGAA